MFLQTTTGLTQQWPYPAMAATPPPASSITASNAASDWEYAYCQCPAAATTATAAIPHHAGVARTTATTSVWHAFPTDATAIRAERE